MVAPLRGSWFTYKIVCRSGVLCFGGCDDFLVCIENARQMKRRMVVDMPGHTLRAQLFTANGRRVSREDLSAALRALRDENVRQQVLARMQARKAPGAATAQRAACSASFGAVFLVFLGFVFCQAGVVAPPDSPDLGNFPVSAKAWTGM